MQKALDFLAEVRVELTKVIWPTPNTTVRLTIIVIAVTVVVGFFLGLIDLLLAEGFKQLISLR